MKIVTLVVLALVLPCTVPAGEAQEPGDNYKLLATTRTGTMQRELDEAAQQGYRIVMGSPTSGSEMALFLHRTAKPPDTYAYKVVATSKTGTMEKELNAFAEEGYRLMPSTMIAKKQMIGPVEIVLLMELAPKSDKQYEYRLLATTRTATLQKEAAEAQAAGYVIVGMVSRGEHMVVMERESARKK